jgi:hypothetical protein
MLIILLTFLVSIDILYVYISNIFYYVLLATGLILQLLQLHRINHGQWCLCVQSCMAYTAWCSHATTADDSCLHITFVCVYAIAGPALATATSSNTKSAGTAPYYFTTPSSATDFSTTAGSSSSNSSNSYEAAPCSIRTRLYFTSESHVSAIVQLLQYPPPGAAPLLDTQARRLLAATPELCYLTQVCAGTCNTNMQRVYTVVIHLILLRNAHCLCEHDSQRELQNTAVAHYSSLLHIAAQ